MSDPRIISELQNHGINLIPLVPNTKQPAVAWKKFQHEKNSDTIDPRYNYGMICGQISDGLVVIDIDCRDQDLVEKIIPNALSITPVVKTGGKGHHIIAKSKKPLKTMRFDGPLGHIDIQSEGTYAVGPSSIHPNGKCYELINDLTEIPYLNFEEILKNIHDLGFNQTSDNKNGFSEGHRNNGLFNKVIYLRNEYHLDYDNVLSEILLYNKKNNPPLPEDEVIHIVNSAFRYSVKDEEKNHLQIADELMSDFRFRTLADTKEILVYQDGVYQNGGENIIFEEVYKRVPDCTINKKREITSAIQAQTLIKRDDFDTPGLLCLENCILDIKTGITEEHSPNSLFRVKIPVFYDPLARCPKFLKFLDECHSSPESKISVIEGAANILLGKTMNLEKVIMHVGNGNNGKSTFLKLIANIIGNNNTTSVSIHDLIDRRFTPAQLDGKMANIYTDITDKEISNLGIIKMLVSGDPVTVEHKNQPPFIMHSFAKHFFSCNKMPDIRDDSDATYRRFLPISWDEKFEGNSVNPNLLNELVEEKSGIFNLLVENAKTLLRNKSFRYGKSISDVSKEMKNQANRERQFLLEFVNVGESKFVSKTLLYSTYLKWCKDSGVKSSSSSKFNSEVKKQFGIDNDDRKKVDGENIRVWCGIYLNDPRNQVFSTSENSKI